MLIFDIVAWFEQINWLLVGIVTVLYALSIFTFISYVEIRRYDVTNSLLERPILGVLVRNLLSLRKLLKMILLAVPLYFITKPESEEFKKTISDSFLVIVLAISSIWIYAYLFFRSNGLFNDYTSFSAINHGDLMKAMGSLFLAFEAVVAGSYRLEEFQNQTPDDEESQLKQHVKQYSLRFSGAMLLAGGYGFFILSALYQRLNEILHLPEPVWVMLIILSLMIGIERALANFLAFASLTLLFISVTAIWYAFTPIVAIGAILGAFGTYLSAKKHLDYPGFRKIVTESVKKNNPT